MTNTQQPTSALLFAAGLGTRMGHLSKDRPKPLIKVGKQTLLDHALELVTTAGIKDTVVNAHYKAEMIQKHLQGTSIRISDETDLLRDTGGGLRHALPLLGSGPVVNLNTDAIWHGPNPIELLRNAWRPHIGALLLIVPKENTVGHVGKGDFDILDDGTLMRAPGGIYTGAQIIDPAGLSGITEDVFSMNVVWDKLAKQGKLFGVTYTGKWCDVGQPESIPLGEAMLRSSQRV